jgi:hypothetical protein
MNGVLVAGNKTLVGAFTRFTIDVTALAIAGAVNAIALELRRPVDRGLDETPQGKRAWGKRGGCRSRTCCARGTVLARRHGPRHHFCGLGAAAARLVLSPGPTPRLGTLTRCTLADSNLGIWDAASVVLTGPVAVAHPLVNTALLPGGAAVVTLGATLRAGASGTGATAAMLAATLTAYRQYECLA